MTGSPHLAPQPPSPLKHPMPFVRVELVVLAVRSGSLCVLLGHRKEEPHRNQWGLPGGVLRIDLDESLAAAAQRVAGERIGRALPNLHQVAAVGGAKRDARAPWAMSVVYRSLVQATLETQPGKRVQALDWRLASEAIADPTLAFDHAQLIQHAVEDLRREVQSLRFPIGWLPKAFTLSELQGLSEAVLGVKLGKVTFRRRMELEDVARPLEGQKRQEGPHRPAQLYVLRADECAQGQ